MTLAAEELGEILSRDAQGRVLISQERRELLLEQYDRSGMSGVKFAEYIGIKYSTLAYWLQSRRRKREREKLLLKAGIDTEPSKSNGPGLKRLLRTVHSRACQAGALRIYFAEAPTVRSVMRLRRQWLRSYLDGSVQSDDQLQWKPQDIFDGRLLRHAQRLQRSLGSGEQRLWRGSSKRSALRLL
jgi:transposase